MGEPAHSMTRFDPNSILFAVASVAGAFTLYRMRALTVWREAAAAFEAKANALQTQLTTEIENRHTVEKEVLRLQGAVKVLEQRPDYSAVAEQMRQHSDAVLANHAHLFADHKTLLEASRFQRQEHGEMVDALDKITARLGEMSASISTVATVMSPRVNPAP